MAKVSIVTSVYNKGPYLERFFSSILSQTFTDIEVIVVDNASTDESVGIIDEYARNDCRIRVIRLKDNIGPGGGYSAGIENVNTEFFGLFDCDDYVDSNYIEVLYTKLIENHADFSMCTNDMIWDNGVIKVNKRPGKDILFTEEDIPNLLPQLIDHHSNEYLGYFLAELGVMWGKLYRTSFIRNNHINFKKDEWMWCDWLFHFKVIKKMHRMIYTEGTTYHFLQSEGSVTRSNALNRDKLAQISYMVEMFDNETKEVLTENLVKALNKFVFRNMNMIIAMYISYYPENVSRNELNDVIKTVLNWPILKEVSLFNAKGLTIRNRIKLELLRYNIIVTLLKRKIKAYK